GKLQRVAGGTSYEDVLRKAHVNLVAPGQRSAVTLGVLALVLAQVRVLRDVGEESIFLLRRREQHPLTGTSTRSDVREVDFVTAFRNVHQVVGLAVAVEIAAVDVRVAALDRA
nr:hypothetical protein [Tanacetum cinerariifolium]